MSDFDFDVFGVTETWLNPSIPSNNYSISGYSMLRSDRQDNSPGRVGGGVALYVKEGIVHEQYSVADQVDPGIEYICVVMKLKGIRLGLCVVYRPPHLRYTSLTALFHSLFVELAVTDQSVA